MMFNSNMSLAECFTTETSYVYQQKQISKKERVCTIQDKGIHFYVSEKCLEESEDQKSNCVKGFNEHVIKIKIDSDDIRVGSPGFKLCRELKGTPQIFKLNRNGKVEETDRCLFSEEKWFENSWLMRKYLKK